METEEKSLMDSLTEAFDSTPQDDNDQVSTEDEAFEAEPSEESGYESDGGEEAEPSDSAPVEDVGETEDESEVSSPLDEPPRDLSPEARAEWDNVPEAVKAAIHKRSQDFENGIKKYASQAKKGDAIDQVVTPYRQLFAMNQVSPPEMIGQLLNVAAVLQMGTPAQKAQTLANMIDQFGVDVDHINQHWSGAQPQMSEEDRIEQIIQQRLAPIQQEFQTRQQQEHQARMQQTAAELNQFAQDPEHKYFADVRMEMADLLETASKRGHQMSLKDAYERACLAHPEVSKAVMAERSRAMVGRKKQTSSSIHGTPAGASETQPTDIRGHIERAIEKSMRI